MQVSNLSLLPRVPSKLYTAGVTRTEIKWNHDPRYLRYKFVKETNFQSSKASVPILNESSPA